MNRCTMKKAKRKIIPRHFQKKDLSRSSNTSLSQLLCIGSYKKKIKDLLHNNQTLACALQESRCEIAYQSKLLKEYANRRNQITSARLKLKDMAKTITKLAIDLAEVENCLDIDFAGLNADMLTKNGPHERLKIVAPDYDCISEENDILASEDEDPGGASNSEPSVPLDVSSPDKNTSNQEMSEIQLSNLEYEPNLPNLLDLPPVLFVEKPVEMSTERKSSRKSKISAKAAAAQLSLTPELDIDIPYLIRKSSSRRQTRTFSSQSPGRRLSRRSSLNRISGEYDTPKRNLIPSESTAQRKLSPDLINSEECTEENSIQEKIFVNTKERSSKNSYENSLSDLQYSSSNIITIPESDLNKSTGNSSVNLPIETALNTALCSELNCTLLLSADMELTDVIHPISGTIAENLNINMAPITNLDAPPPPTFEKICSHTDMYQNEGEKNCHNSIQDDDNGFDDKKLLEHNSPDKSLIESPSCKRSSRKRKVVKYIEFSSTESESDSTPAKLNKSGEKRIHRDTVIFKPLTKKNSGCNGSVNKSTSIGQHSNKLSPNALSVFDLDVSNSKKPIKKSRPKSKPKNSQNKEITKPLLQKCNITKLKGAEYKFTKNENNDMVQKENEQLVNCKSPETNILSNGVIKENNSNFPFNYTEKNVSPTKNRESTSTLESTPGEKDLQLSETTLLKTPKRVSFASTDLVCNFKKMSLTKAIAHNKKVQRTSKFTFDNDVAYPQTSEKNDTKDSETDKLSGDLFKDLETNICNTSDDTELYTFTIPTNEIPTIANECTQSSAKILTPPNMQENYDKHKTVKCDTAVSTKLGKLSLKKNKNSEMKNQHHILDEINVDSISLKGENNSGKKSHTHLLSKNTDVKKSSPHKMDKIKMKDATMSPKGHKKSEKKSNNHNLDKIGENYDITSVEGNKKSQPTISDKICENIDAASSTENKKIVKKSQPRISNKKDASEAWKRNKSSGNKMKNVEDIETDICIKKIDSKSKKKCEKLGGKSQKLILNKDKDVATVLSDTNPTWDENFQSHISDNINVDTLLVKKKSNSVKNSQPYILDTNDKDSKNPTKNTNSEERINPDNLEIDYNVCSKLLKGKKKLQSSVARKISEDLQTLDNFETETHGKAKTSNQSCPHSLKILLNSVPIDDIKKFSPKSSKSSKKLHLADQENTPRGEKNGKSVEPSPLKEIQNLEELNRKSYKRTIKVVSYAEPKLNKKMRRT